jgi:hypothetical protein
MLVCAKKVDVVHGEQGQGGDVDAQRDIGQGLGPVLFTEIPTVMTERTRPAD